MSQEVIARSRGPRGKRPPSFGQLYMKESRWIHSFAKNSPSPLITHDSISPGFALRQINLAVENRKFDDCSQLINQMNQLTLKEILPEIQMGQILERIPHSLIVLESLFSKLFIADPEHFPTQHLPIEALVFNIVQYLASQEALVVQKQPGFEQIMRTVTHICRIVAYIRPEVVKLLHHRKKAMEEVLTGMGEHGLVSAGGSLVNLHDALKMELERNMADYKLALQKLEELSLSHQRPLTLRSSVSGKAPVLNHQQVMRFTQDHVQDRLFKNKSLLDAMEASLDSQLPTLHQTLQQRIENDKSALLTFGQVRKENRLVRSTAALGPAIQQYIEGLSQIMDIFKEVCGDGKTPSDVSESEDTLVQVRSSPEVGSVVTNGTGKAENGETPFIRNSRPRAVSTDRRRRDKSRDKSRDRSHDRLRDRSLDRNLVKSSISNPQQQSIQESHDFKVMIDRINKLSASGRSSLPFRINRKEEQHHQPPVSANTSSAHHTFTRPEGERARAPLMVSACIQTDSDSQMEQAEEQTRILNKTIQTYQQREKLMMKRLADYAKRANAVQQGSPRVGDQGAFEARGQPPPPQQQALVPGSPSMQLENPKWASLQRSHLIHSYRLLYTESRVDALDALDIMSDRSQFEEGDELKSKLLFSVVVLSFRAVQKSIQKLRLDIRHLLSFSKNGRPGLGLGVNQGSLTRGQGASGDSLMREILKMVMVYLRKTAETNELPSIKEEVCQQLFATLYDYPSLQSSQVLKHYVDQCVKTAWQLSIQSPPLVIEYEANRFDQRLHERFHRGKGQGDVIHTYLWPSLLDSATRECVYKGVVIT